MGLGKEYTLISSTEADKNTTAYNSMSRLSKTIKLKKKL